MIRHLGVAVLGGLLGIAPVRVGTVSADVSSGDLQLAQEHLQANEPSGSVDEKGARRDAQQERNEKLKAQHLKQGEEHRNLHAEKVQRKQEQKARQLNEEGERHQALQERNQKLKAEHSRQREKQHELQGEKVDRRRSSGSTMPLPQP